MMLKEYEGRSIRTAWDAEKEEWYFSIVDVVGALTDQPTQRGASNYWAKMKERLKAEGADQLLTNCQQLKMRSLKDGKRYLTDVADTEQLFRIIQSIPSPKAVCGRHIEEHPAHRLTRRREVSRNLEEIWAGRKSWRAEQETKL